MKALKREQKIIALLESRGELSVKELSEILDVSLSTLRKQLAVMQQNGLVIRTYGGVMSVNRVPDETFESKLHKNIAEKRRIAEKARALIPAGSSIALGSGTTVYTMANLGYPTLAPNGASRIGVVWPHEGERKNVRQQPDVGSRQITVAYHGKDYACYDVTLGSGKIDWYYIFVESDSKWGWIASGNADLVRDAQ